MYASSARRPTQSREFWDGKMICIYYQRTNEAEARIVTIGRICMAGMREHAPGELRRELDTAKNILQVTRKTDRWVLRMEARHGWCWRTTIELAHIGSVLSTLRL
jgi:hypothetical protein